MLQFLIKNRCFINRMIKEEESTFFLSQEAEYFYGDIFSAPAPKLIVEKYIAVNTRKFFYPDEKIRSLVVKKADIEAIEIAWRFKSPRNPLTQKIHILLYLAETVPGNFPLFFNTGNKRISSFIILPCHFIRSIGKLIKGKFLLKRYRLV